MNAFQWVGSLELRHFSPAEILHNHNAPGNTLPPEELWPNIALTATVLDALRASFGRPVTITSSYRSPRYNRAVGGAPLSQHPAWTALDFQVRGVAPAEAAARLREWRGRRFDLPVQVERVHYVADAGPVPFEELTVWDERHGAGSVMEWHGGVGVYRTFVHVDSRGIDHSWSGGG